MLKRDRSIIFFIALLFFRIPLSHIIGDNGMGYLSGPMEIFICLLFAFGSGVAGTMQGMMYDRMRRGQYRNAGVVYKLGVKYTVIVSSVLLILCVLLYDFISTKLLAESGQRLAFLLVGPAVFLGMFIRLNEGFLIGTENGKAAVVGQLVEAFTGGIGMLIGGYFGQKYGIKVAFLLHNQEVSAMYAAFGTMIGLCAGELIALIILLVMSIIYDRSFKHMINSDSTRRAEYNSDISGKLFSGIVKDGAQNLVIQLPIIIMIVIYRRYAIAALIGDCNDAVGAFYAKYLVVIGVATSIAVVIIQTSMRGIVAAINDSDEVACAERMSKLFGRIMYYAIPASVFIAMLVQPISATLFTGRITTVNSLLTIGSVMIIIYSLMYMFMVVLNRLGYSMEMLMVSSVSLVICIIAAIVLVGKKGMEFKGIVILLMLNYMVNAVFAMFIIFRNYKLKIHLLQYVILPLIISGVIGIIAKLLSGALLNLLGGAITLIICLIPAWFGYNIACMFLRVVSAGAMSKKIFGNILVRIGQKMGIY